MDCEKQINIRRNKAEEILNNADKGLSLVEDASSKVSTLVSRHPIFFSKKIKQIALYVPLLLSLIRSYIHKEYKEIPLMTMISIVAAVIYFVSPFDILPDFIPGLGYVDDATVIAFLVASIKTDLDKYRKWKDSQITVEQ